MTEEAVLASLEEVVRQAWDKGCPVAGERTEEHAERARVALRRWRSFDRRHKKSDSARTRIEDLAKGLRDAFGGDRHLVGPLMEDYRWLAEQLANKLQDAA